MKQSQILTTALVAFSALVLNCGQKPAQLAGDAYPVAKASGTNFNLDVNQSKIEWIGAKVSMKHNGLVNLKSGNLSAKGGEITSGKFIIDLPSLVNSDLEGTWKAKLEGHLKSEDFFNVEKFPEAIFEIASVTKADKGYDVRGNLTIKGITKGISFPAEIQFEGEKPVSAKAKAVINRKDWGIVYPGMPDDLISDTVEFNLNLVTQ
ncbi:YceI family protein [Leptospira ryugenii]|uniref:YceI family protein n=1 Tax=Leptospira ryugenii TaxID=1917863 RepID=A0A2P2E1R8_9LEPT|nr:YceI family protein [Leptospira ryugenii]GBF50835.1 YceI family protein [Leptospira ryugenii]